MKDFVCHVKTQVFFGPSKGQEFTNCIAELGYRNVLLVTGGGSVKKLGYFSEVGSKLAEAGVAWVEFEGIEPNPLSKTINRAAQFARREQVQAVFALGGGSVMDASKAIAALLLSGDEDIWPFVLGSPRHGQLRGAYPVFAVPTTAATASEVTPFAVISNAEAGGKAPLGYEFLKPTASWINPEFTTKLPTATTQDGAADILSHVFENYLLGGSDAVLTDRYCESIIRTVMDTLPQVLADPENVDYRGTMLWCSTLALNGMHCAGRNPSAYILHAIEHALSAANHSLAHGRGLATLFPAYFRWLWQHKRARDRLARLGREIFGLSGPEEQLGLYFIEQFELWLRTNGLLQGAEDVGVPREQFAAVADYAVRTYGNGQTMDALGPMTKDDVVEVLEATASQRATTIISQ